MILTFFIALFILFLLFELELFENGISGHEGDRRGRAKESVVQSAILTALIVLKCCFEAYRRLIH